ncbi:MAG: pyruvate:ferredoxin (flavodoxin) oxidoreductase [Anaerolineales bacterium]
MSKAERQIATIDANEAAARVAHKTNEVIAIYPITPASPMGEWADQWTTEGETNLWGAVPLVVEMQAEGGAAGAVHGSLQAGALTTTFTASQGLLLMIPNMYKIAGELTPAVIHVAARSVAAQALSIFGDHSDVMAARNTGFALLASNSVQEAQDFAAISQSATLRSRVPFLHFFDGFRTSHEINKIELLSDEVIASLIDDELIEEHRARALSPDRPVIRGTAQNPDVFFQARESVNPFYDACPQVVQEVMDEFAEQTGRAYHLFDYVGSPEAERVVVLMGSGAEAAQETVEALMEAGEKVGVLKVRLYRPLAPKALLASLPETVKGLAVLDRTKEPGASGEPLYLDVVSVISEAEAEGELPLKARPKVIGGRYGLSSKEFTPAMVKAVLDELKSDKPQNHFTIGIKDDVTDRSLDYDKSFEIENPGTVRAVFYGLGSDGTVSANKNSIKIIGEETDQYAQGYFQYDSKKAGSRTVSHLRFGPEPIRSTYLIQSANFVACHQMDFVEQIEVLRLAERGAIFLLNTPYGPEEIWDHLPESMQKTIIDQELEFYVLDGYEVAKQVGLGQRINTVMQTAFFALAEVLPKEQAIAEIKNSIEKTYGKRGEEIVKRNFRAVDAALDHLHKVDVPEKVGSEVQMKDPVPADAPQFVQEVTAKIIAGLGDDLPVSMLPEDGTYPMGTTKYEKRNIAQEIPVWDTNLCIQCGKCVFVCPHAVIRQKVYDSAQLTAAPENFKSAPARFKEFKDQVYTLQVEPEECTGCALCFEACPVKDKSEPKRRAINMEPQRPLREQERENWDFFVELPEMDPGEISMDQVKYSQLLQPLFEFSGACAGCGETPYLKLLSQLFGDHSIIANATGCSSIYGGNLPTHPWATNKQGRGPAWSNSLFEDNAEFGFGMRVALDQRRQAAAELLDALREEIGDKTVDEILNADQSDSAGLDRQRERISNLKGRLEKIGGPKAKRLAAVADSLVKTNIWIVGGDGWAYDIGFGGLDHVLASGRNINVLVLDTEVYSNTGGQKSKATPRGAVAKFAAGGKGQPKKDLGQMAMTYGNVYVAQVAMGKDDRHTLRAFLEAESYDGPSLIISYTHCIAHGYDLRYGLGQQERAVDSGYWPLYRFDPRLAEKGENPLQLDSREPKLPLEEYMYKEGRFRMLTQSYPERAEELLKAAKGDVMDRWAQYQRMAQPWNGNGSGKSDGDK